MIAEFRRRYLLPRDGSLILDSVWIAVAQFMRFGAAVEAPLGTEAVAMAVLSKRQVAWMVGRPRLSRISKAVSCLIRLMEFDQIDVSENSWLRFEGGSAISDKTTATCRERS